jgi:hypothetical protein
LEISVTDVLDALLVQRRRPLTPPTVATAAAGR